MANYEYVCHECFLLLPKEFPFGKPKKKVECPECGKMCEQNWAGRDIPVHFKGAGWTGKNSSTGFNKAGGSDEVNRQLQDNSKLRSLAGSIMQSIHLLRSYWIRLENLRLKRSNKS